jgi:hypothetical protein
MNRNDAIKSIADQLAERAEADMAQAKARLGDRADVVANDIDYHARAADLLDGAIVSLAYSRVTNDLTGWAGMPQAAAAPPVPCRAPGY